MRDLTPPVVEPPPPAKGREILPARDLLKEKLDVGGQHPGWGQDTPVVYANPADAPLKLLNGAIVVPPRTVVAHPGPDRDVAVGWQSPLTGKVNLRAKVVHGHPGGGDGVSWSIVHESPADRKVLAQGVIDHDGAQSIPAAADAGKLTGAGRAEGRRTVAGRRPARQPRLRHDVRRVGHHREPRVPAAPGT